MPKQFTRTIEDFTCEHCGAAVTGNGYTNHCPKCLWSKHVDVNPGDRAASCGGMMEPKNFTKRGGDYFIVQKCQVCGFERTNSFSIGDDFDALLRLAETVAQA